MQYRLIGLLSICLFVSPYSFSSQTVVFCTDVLPPFTIKAEPYIAGKDMRSRLMQEIFAQLEGFDAQLHISRWKACQSSVRRGKVDGILLIFKSLEREKYYDFTDPLVMYNESVFYNAKLTPNGSQWQTLDDIKNLTIGLQKGFSYPNNINQLISSRDLKAQYVDNIRQNLLKLSSGRVDFILEGELSTLYTLNKMKLDTPIKKAFTITQSPLNIAFSKKSPAMKLIPLINKIIAQMKTDGRLDKIIRADY